LNGNAEKYLITAWNAGIEAASAIMKVYKKLYEIEYKQDDSPVTIADKQADEIILRHLRTTGIPVITEESAHIPFEQRKLMNELWIVDPLDGTKEFIRHSTDFTVNIAWIKNGNPILGVIIAPALNLGYWGTEEAGAFKTLDIRSYSFAKNLINQSKPIRCSPGISEPLRITGTKSHMNHETELFYEKIKTKHPNARIISVGSSLKFCKVAEGKADLYVRLSSINEWDTAAGDAILRCAGGKTLDLQNWIPLSYNKPSMLTPPFVSLHPNKTLFVKKLFE
jgi:3'(2'), 5'-bisphosphate nucleotidase